AGGPRDSLGAVPSGSGRFPRSAPDAHNSVEWEGDSDSACIGPTEPQPIRSVRSILVGGEDLAPSAGAQEPPGLEADRVLDEVDRAIHERDVHAAGVVAGGVHA